jgi:hypothetical protein
MDPKPNKSQKGQEVELREGLVHDVVVAVAAGAATGVGTQLTSQFFGNRVPKEEPPQVILPPGTDHDD